MRPELFEDVSPPAAGENYKLTHSTTAARYKCPPEWLGQMVTFSSAGSDLDVSFGDAGVIVAAASRSKTSGEYIAPNHASGLTVVAGGTVSFPVPNDATHFSVVSSDTTGSWTAFRSSGTPNYGAPLNLLKLADFDASVKKSVITDSGAVTVTSLKSIVGGYEFTPGNKPDWLSASAVGTDMVQPGISFVAGSSESLKCTNAELAEALSAGNPFSLFFAVRRTAATAAHTLMSVGTDGTNNSRWDVTLDASDDFVFTVVDSGGTSITYTAADTYSAGVYLLTLTFAGNAAPTFYKNRTATALTPSGTLGGLGTADHVTIGARAYNTSTIDQYASAEFARILLFSRVLSALEVDTLHTWAAHRFGV